MGLVDTSPTVKLGTSIVLFARLRTNRSCLLLPWSGEEYVQP